ncbi:helix-turn-helix domain-containing protein [Anabaena sp. CCY 9910]|uniref:helix-turn-helix domain-containing protein n=1 Tax=Anabaena sp. CCY 9910 TaxID=3103870 RepID=UPI0039E10605
MAINPATIDPLALPSVSLQERSQLPTTPCIYFAIDSQGVVQYIGQTKNPRKRWLSHHKGVDIAMLGEIRISYLHCDPDLLPIVENALIAWFNPPLNRGAKRRGKPEKTKIIIEVEFTGIGTALKKAREAAGMSLTVAGDYAGMSGANFNRIENEDTKGVPLDTLIRAANAVGLDLKECLGEWIQHIPGVNLTESSNGD